MNYGNPQQLQPKPSLHAGKSSSQLTIVTSSSNAAIISPREAYLNQKEKEIFNREAIIRKKENHDGDKLAPNWPRCFPLIYHDINNDVPVAAQWIVKRLYGAFWREYYSSLMMLPNSFFIVALGIYFVNFLAAFALLIIKEENSSVNFGISIVNFIVGVPVAFIFWYRVFYRKWRVGIHQAFFE